MPPIYAIDGNSFVGNTTYAVVNQTSTDLDCSGNWWGNITGPQHRANPLGLGNSVSDHVIYLPYAAQSNLPYVVLSEHRAGQAPNAFGTNTNGDLMLFRFGLADDSGLKVTKLVMNLVDSDGLVDGSLQDFRLILDVNGTGIFDPGQDQVLSPGTVNWDAGTLTFTAPFRAKGQFLVTGRLANAPTNAVVKLRLNPQNIQLDFVSTALGSVEDAVHFRNRIVLADHRVGPFRDGFSAAESQDATLIGFYLSPGCNVTGLRFDLSDINGLDAANFVSLKLVADANGDGVAGTNETSWDARLLSLGGGVGTIVVDSNAKPFASGTDFLLRAKLSGLRAGDALTISLSSSGITSDAKTPIIGSTQPVRHVVDTPYFVTDSGFQVGNQFTAADSLKRVSLAGFRFIPPGWMVSHITFRLSEIYGIHAGDISNVRIFLDENQDGMLETNEIHTVGGVGAVEIDETNGVGAIQFSASFAVQGSYLLVADLAQIAPDDSLTVGLSGTDIASGQNVVVEGGVSPVRHFVHPAGLSGSTVQQNWALTWRSPGGLHVVGGYSRDGRKAVIGYDSGAAYVYDLESGVPRLMLLRHYDGVRYAGFSGDDSRIITVTRDGGVYLWNSVTGNLEQTLFADVMVSYAAPSPDFTRLLVVTADRAFLLNLLDGRHLWEFTVGSPFNCVDFSPDGKRVILGCDDKRAYVLDADTGAIPRIQKNGITYDLVFQGHHDVVRGVAFTANGTRIMTASRDATATLWYAEDPINPISTVALSGQSCDYAWVNRVGDRIAMITSSRYLRVFDDEGREIYDYDIPRDQFTAALNFATFSDDGTEFVIGSSDYYGSGSVVSRFRTSNHAFLQNIGPIGRISEAFDSLVKMSGDGKRVFFMKNNCLEVMQRTTGVPIRRYGDLAAAAPYDITPDGNKIAWDAGGTLNYAIVDDDRLTPIAANWVGQTAPLTLSRSGGLAAIGDKLVNTLSGDLFADNPEH